MDIQQLIELRHHPGAIIDLAHRAGAEIPFEEKGTRNLLDSYRASGLMEFHRRFYAAGQAGHARRKHADDGKSALAALPPCARHVLANPNDLLLKPSGMQLVTRCLLAEGWHPQAHRRPGSVPSSRTPPMAGTRIWTDYDPVLRAEFYVRLIAGQIDQGIDTGIDFNCCSQQEKHFCWNPGRLLA